MSREIAEQFHAVFDGLRAAHGSYTLRGAATPGKKHAGSAGTRKGPATVELWEGHLAGSGNLLGVVPIRDDNTCLWGGLDIDKYDLDLLALNALIRAIGLPLLVFRSKSGGAHCLVFLREPIAANVLRAKLRYWSGLLGFGTCEVFPKQDRIVSDEDRGSWLNMPYHGGDTSMRYCLHPTTGAALTPAECLHVIDEYKLTPDELVRHTPAAPPPGLDLPDPTHPPEGRGPLPPTLKGSPDDILPDGPPCLNYILNQGVPDGARNGVLFALATYIKKTGETDVADRALSYNDKYFNPPLPRNEAIKTARSAEKKDYNYKCKDPPLLTYCDRELCRLRKFGVSMEMPQRADGGEMSYGPLVKILTDPPHWQWEINGRMVPLDSDGLLDQGVFHKAVLNALNIMVVRVRESRWKEIVTDALKNLQEIAAPEDATFEGAVWDKLRDFCTNRQGARNRDEVKLGRAYEEGGAVFFQSSAFIKELRRDGGSVSERKVYLALQQRNVSEVTWNVKGTNIKLWSVPAFDRQAEEYDTPRTDPEAPRL